MSLSVYYTTGTHSTTLELWNFLIGSTPVFGHPEGSFHVDLTEFPRGLITGFKSLLKHEEPSWRECSISYGFLLRPLGYSVGANGVIVQRQVKLTTSH